MTNLHSILKSRDITLATKVRVVKAMVFLVVMYGCESWTIKKAESWRTDALTVVLEKTFESPLDCKEIKPVNPKENQSWIFIGRTDAETPIVWPPDWPLDSLEKILMLGKIEGRRRRVMRMIRLNSIRLSGHESEPTLGNSRGQRSLACCSPWGHKELAMTEVI